MSSTSRPVAVVIGATSKWQADGRNTKLAHGRSLDDSELSVGVRWGVGGAVAQKFAREGFLVVLTTRSAANAKGLHAAIREQGGACMTVELDLVSDESISRAFAAIRSEAGDPEAVIYNAGYLEGRDLPPDQELLEYIPLEMFETAQHIASRGLSLRRFRGHLGSYGSAVGVRHGETQAARVYTRAQATRGAADRKYKRPFEDPRTGVMSNPRPLGRYYTGSGRGKRPMA